MSSLFKTKAGKSTQTSETTKTLPSWLQSAYQDLIAQSQAAGNMGMTPEEQQAASFLAGNIGNYQGAFDNSVGSTQSILDKLMAGGPSTADIQAGMNPYLDLVLNRQRQEADKSYYSGLSQLQDQEVNAGAFGGSRSAVAQETLRNNYADNLAKLQEQGLYNAFETSRNQYNQNLANSLGASVNLANLGGAAQQGVMNTATGLAQAGAMPRNIAQGNSSFLNSIINPAAQTMVGSNQTSTTTTQAPQGSLFSQLLGTGLSIAGMAGGFGGLGNMLSGGMFGATTGGQGLFNGGIRNAINGANGYYGPGFARGGMIPDKNKFKSGGAVKEMPEWLRNDPYLSPIEKEMMWDGMAKEEQFYEQYRPAADREYRLENIPMSAPEVDDTPQPRYEAAPGVTVEYPSDLEELIAPQVAPLPPRKPSAPAVDKSLLESNTFRKYKNENLSDAQLADIMGRNPGLEGMLNKIDAMSDDEFNAIFAPLSEKDMNRKTASIGARGPVKGFADGGFISPANMTAEEEEAYWRAKQPPSLATILGMRQNSALPKNTLNAYLAGSRPEPVSDAFAAEVEANSKALGQAQDREAYIDGRLARDKALVDFIGRADAGMDEMRAVPDTTGMDRLQRIGAHVGALPRQIAGLAGEATLLPAKAGIKLGEYLAANPDVDEAEAQFEALRAQSEMDSYERSVLDAINSGMYSTDEIAAAVANRNKAPMEQVGEATSASGKSVPVESAKKPTMSEVEKAVKAQEAKPAEKKGMDIPLIMAGIALMTSKGDPFSSMGEGLAAYLGGKRQIEMDKKEAAKQAKAESLAERAMQVDEGKLGVMRDQLQVEGKKIALEAAKLNKEKAYTPDKYVDDVTNRFKVLFDARAASIMPGDGTDMGAEMDRLMGEAVNGVRSEVGLTPIAQGVKLTPSEQLALAMQTKPKR